MNLTVLQLRTFREVMRAGSVSEAARVLGRTQPAVSAMIAGLERQVGFALFVREHGRLTPRPEAHYVLEEAEAVLDRLAQSARTLAEIAGLRRGRLRIACHPAASGFFMPGLLAEFLRGRDGLEAALMMRSSAIVQDLVASQEYDIGLAETPAPRRSILTESFDLDCLCAIPAGDPLACAALVTPADLDGRPLATLFDDHGTYRAMAAAFAEADCRLERRFVLRTFLPALQLVESGLCYCLCDMISAWSYGLYRTEAPGLVFRPFRPRVHASVSILRPAHRPPSLAAEAFGAALAAELRRVAALMGQG